jgi:hypothetical protein
MRCHACGTQFCYYHSNAHTGRTCEEYREEIEKLDRLAETGAMKGSKACPKCGIMTDRTGGCQHMTCKRCGCDWCWSCGELIEGGGAGVTEHYYFGRCSQFEDENPTGCLACYFRCVSAPLRILSMLLFVVTSIIFLVLLLVLTLFFCIIAPLQRCRGRTSEQALHVVFICALVMAYIPFVPFLLVCAVYITIFWLLVRPCGATRQHFHNLCLAPLLSPLVVVHLVHLGLQRQDERWDNEDFADESSDGSISGSSSSA